jgi:hypothetical protein
VLKKTVTYEDFNGETVSEDFFFHLSKAELVELELSHEGGLSEALKKIVESEDGKSIIAEFKNIILSAYGKKSPDGRRFIKNQELRDEFESSEAYSTLFMELVTNAEAAADFVNGVIPQGMAEEAAKLASTETRQEIAVVSDPPDIEPGTREPKVLTKKDIDEMPAEEMEQLGARLASGEVKLGE